MCAYRERVYRREGGRMGKSEMNDSMHVASTCICYV